MKLFVIRNSKRLLEKRFSFKINIEIINIKFFEANRPYYCDDTISNKFGNAESICSAYSFYFPVEFNKSE